MMPITIAQLVAAGIGPVQAQQFAGPLTVACTYADISTPARVAAFVAQCAHESARFTATEENLFYLDPARLAAVFPTQFPRAADAAPYVRHPQALANRVYANRLGNGSEASGDGWRYRGRGLLQITGRVNYVRIGHLLGRPYGEQPDCVAQPPDAALTAAQFWMQNDCNHLADVGQLDVITRRINGAGMAGQQDRRELYAQAQQVFA